MRLANLNRPPSAPASKVEAKGMRKARRQQAGANRKAARPKNSSPVKAVRPAFRKGGKITKGGKKK